MTAALMRKAVIPIGTFDGGAYELWRTSRESPQQFYYGAVTTDDVDRLIDDWDDTESATFIVDVMEKVLASHRAPTAPPHVTLSAVLVLIVAMVAWIGCLALGWNHSTNAQTAAPNAVPAVDVTADTPATTNATMAPALIWLLTTVCVAGIIGATTGALNDIRGDKPVTGMGLLISVSLGISAAAISAIIYLLAGVGVGAELGNTAAGEKYARSAVVMSSIAIFAGLYLDTAFKRFHELQTSGIGRGESLRSENFQA